jgi:Peptidase family M23
VPPFERDPEPLTSHRTTARSILLVLLGLAAGVGSQSLHAQTYAGNAGDLDPKQPTTSAPTTSAPSAPSSTTRPKPKPVVLGNRLIFPVVGPVQYTDDFGAPRAGGRHEGNDVMAAKKSLAVAVENGAVKFGHNSAHAGCYLYLYGKSGTYYLYIHLNNDVTMGNDNRGKCGPGMSYVKGLKDGQKVKAGEPIGYVGNSGDANGTAPHLHFEVHPHGGAAVDPYPYLNRALRLLFALKRGSTFTLNLSGTVAAAGLTAEGSVKENVSTVRTFPSGYKTKGVSRTIQIWLPDTATVERKANGVTRTVTNPAAALKKKASLQISTASAACTLLAQIGAANALAADRVVVGPLAH